MASAARAIRARAVKPAGLVKAGPLVVFLDVCTLHEQLGETQPAVRVISNSYPVLLEVTSPGKEGSKLAMAFEALQK